MFAFTEAAKMLCSISVPQIGPHVEHAQRKIAPQALCAGSLRVVEATGEANASFARFQDQPAFAAEYASLKAGPIRVRLAKI